MRELTVRIRFTRHSLGNVKSGAEGGRFTFARSQDGFVLFMPAWHRENLRLAAQVLGRHQDEVDKICWDIRVDGSVGQPDYKRYFGGGGSKKRYALHEAFWPGQVVGLHCVVPTPISDDDLRRLMQLAGQYRGLSPWKPGEFGLFEVDQILPRRVTPAPDESVGEAIRRPESAETGR